MKVQGGGLPSSRNHDLVQVCYRWIVRTTLTAYCDGSCVAMALKAGTNTQAVGGQQASIDRSERG